MQQQAVFLVCLSCLSDIPKKAAAICFTLTKEAPRTRVDSVMKVLLLLLLSVCLVCLQRGYCSTDLQDVFALKSLANQWKNTPPSWGNSDDPCGDEWEGITCKDSRVTELKLFSVGIEGTLSSNIENLTELEHLDLSYNQNLGGRLPPSIGKLKKLKTLRLINCKFGELIPDELGNLLNLNVLSLNSNQFIGNIPATVGRLQNLAWFDLADNQLTGPLPTTENRVPGLDLLVNTAHFHLNKNQLSGPIPNDLFSSKMKAVHVLLDHNNFSGEIPNSIGSVQSLEVLRLDMNSLNGPVPSTINKLTFLNVLNLANNQLNGTLPNLTGMHALNYVDLSNNSFDPSASPSWFSDIQNLTTLIIESGSLEGVVPEALFSFPQLQQVRLENNSFNGTLNMGGSNVSKRLKMVNLKNNDLDSVTISSNYNNTIILAGNPVCSNSHLQDAGYCHEQQDSESYYSSVNCRHPYEGPIICRAPFFSDISTNLASMLNIIKDKLNGTQVSFSLHDYFFDQNAYMQVQLRICPSNGKYFTRSQILLWFDLSSQNLELPEFYGPCYFDPSPYSFNRKVNRGLIAGIVVGSTAAVIIIAGLGTYAWWQKKRAKKAISLNNPFASWGSAGEDAGDAPQLRLAKSFSLEEIKKFTDDFSKENEIGSGGYGKVYKGMLSDGQRVAIKRSQNGSAQGGLEFKTEIEMLSRVHHKNLVELIGFCFEKGERMLVYEYISNGTLTENLSGRSDIKLDWKTRLHIALDSARGLAYLHELVKPPIIHRDVKSSNILLDDNFIAKVADFGLSMLVSDGKKEHISTTVKGTLGYLDPEYFMTQQLTTKSDVYSFGVVMLELLTGRVPIQKGKYIVREVRMGLDKNDKEHYGLWGVIDPKLLKTGSLVGLRTFVDLSLQCLEDASEDRPTMNEVVKEIEILLKDDELKEKPTSAWPAASNGVGKSASQQPYDELLVTREINSNDVYRGDKYFSSG